MLIHHCNLDPLYSKTLFYMGIHFNYFCSKTFIVGLVRTASGSALFSLMYPSENLGSVG